MYRRSHVSIDYTQLPTLCDLTKTKSTTMADCLVQLAIAEDWEIGNPLTGLGGIEFPACRTRLGTNTMPNTLPITAQHR
jgi:hypothetical protein